MLRDLLGKVHHAPKGESLSQTIYIVIQGKESRQIESAKKSEDTPLETVIASNPHLPTAKLPLAKVSVAAVSEMFQSIQIILPLSSHAIIVISSFFFLGFAKFCLLFCS